MDPPTPTEAPPPAYESEHDYDRKISDALERSLTISQAQQPSIPPGEEEWEEWDEERHLAAARAREQGGDAQQPRQPIPHHSSEKERLARQDASQADYFSRHASSSTSSAPVPQPSRRLPSSPPAKERPSWYSEAQLDAPAASGSGPSGQPPPPIPQVHDIPPEEEDPDEPLPAFAAVGPSLEGPPFEEVVRQLPRIAPISNVDSPPQSPLGSVESDGPAEPQSYSPPPPSHRTYGDCSRTMSPRPTQAPPVPRVASVPASSQPHPMRFDPSVAYAKHRNTSLFVSEAESREPIDASALYNSSISSLLSPQKSKKKNALHKKELPAKPATTRPESHGPQSLPQSVSPRAPPAPPTQPTQHGSPNPYHPMQQNQGYSPTQYGSYSQQPQPQPQSQPLPQQPQQVAPGFYALPFTGVPQGTQPPPPPPPAQWYPPHNTYGGGYGR